MDVTVVTTHTIIVYQSDFLDWLAAHASDIPLTKGEIRQPLIPDGRSLDLVFPIDQTYLDAFLRGIIQDLPSIGSYNVQPISTNNGGIGRITWTT